MDETEIMQEESEQDTIPADDEEAWLPDDGEDTAEEEAETEPEAEDKAKDALPAAESGPRMLKFTAKLLEGEQDIELDEKELPTVYQKAHNHDRMQSKYTELTAQRKADAEKLERLETLAKSKGFDSVDAMLAAEEALEEDNEAERLSPDNPALGKEIIKLRKQVSAKPKAEPEPQPEPAAPKRDFSAEIAELRKRYPETAGMTRFPDEMNAEVLAGKSVAEAYANHKAKQAEVEKKRLADENKKLKQNEAVRKAAPVKGTKPATVDNDAFMKGFDSEY
jgi:hypothetical protein